MVMRVIFIFVATCFATSMAMGNHFSIDDLSDMPIEEVAKKTEQLRRDNTGIQLHFLVALEKWGEPTVRHALAIVMDKMKHGGKMVEFHYPFSEKDLSKTKYVRIEAGKKNKLAWKNNSKTIPFVRKKLDFTDIDIKNLYLVKRVFK